MSVHRRIPGHMGGCLRDPATGWPAPYINAWVGEMELPWTIGLFEGREAWCPAERRGIGTLDFKAQHMGRQRRLMVDHACQVCRAHGDLLVVGPGLSGKRMVVDGYEGVAFTEPYVCRRCARFALDHCPGLIRHRRAEQLSVITPRTLLPVVLSTGTYDPQPGITAVMWAKVFVPFHMMPKGMPDWFPEWAPT